MSDFKSSFRAQVKAAKPSREQLRALKAKKAEQAAQAEKEAAKKNAVDSQGFRMPQPVARSAPQRAAPPPTFSAPKPPPTASVPKPDPTPAASAVPSGFFDYADNDDDDEPSPASTSAAPPASGGASAWPQPSQAQLRGSQPGALPEGFYADTDADKKARGVEKKKRTLDEEMADFEASVALDLKQAEENEQAEAEDVARDREDREAFEHEMRKQKVEELRGLVKNGPKPTPQASLPTEHKSKRQKTLDMLAGVVSDDDDDDDEDEDLLDWRAKAV